MLQAVQSIVVKSYNSQYIRDFTGIRERMIIVELMISRASCMQQNTKQGFSPPGLKRVFSVL